MYRRIGLAHGQERCKWFFDCFSFRANGVSWASIFDPKFICRFLSGTKAKMYSQKINHSSFHLGRVAVIFIYISSEITLHCTWNSFCWVQHTQKCTINDTFYGFHFFGCWNVCVFEMNEENENWVPLWWGNSASCSEHTHNKSGRLKTPTIIICKHSSSSSTCCCWYWCCCLSTK